MRFFITSRGLTVLLFVAVSAFVLAGCGGGDPEPPCPPVTVKFYGDSIGYRFAKGLQQVADADRGPGRVLVTNLAVGGTSSEQLLNGMDGLNAPWPRGAAADVIFMNHGHNDRTRHVPDWKFQENIEFFVEFGAIVLTPIPVEWRPDAGSPYLAITRAQPGMIDVNAWARSRGEAWFAHLPDGTHPDAMISRAVARTLLLPRVPECGSGQ